MVTVWAIPSLTRVTKIRKCCTVESLLGAHKLRQEYNLPTRSTARPLCPQQTRFLQQSTRLLHLDPLILQPNQDQLQGFHKLHPLLLRQS